MKILSFVVLILLAVSSYYVSFLIDDSAEKKDLANPVPFDEFLGINSIREAKSSVIRDQYQVARFHRIFAMDSYLFTGTEFVVKAEGHKRVVDLSIPHDEYPNDKMGFNPSKGANFNFDSFLQEMKASGLVSIPVLARNLLYCNVPANNVINVWQIPWDDGGDPENPMDYKAYASFLFQFTARYGKNKLTTEGGSINPDLLKLADDNEPKAGLDLVYAIEPGNEMDKDWFTEREQASPRELAAFLSAAIDGHMGLMGPGHGILEADPSMKILFPSPADIKPDYVIEVLNQLKKIRHDAPKYGKIVLPEDNLILTAHFYPFSERFLQFTPSSDIVENTDLLNESLEFIQALREVYDCPIYMTETGYDKVIQGVSQIGAPVLKADRMDNAVVSTYAQAKHVLRLLLTMYAAGYDKAFIFMLSDPVALTAPGFKTKYATSGLTRKNGDKDIAWYVVDYLKKRLTGFYLEQADFSKDIKVMRLRKDDQLAYIYWSGTAKNITTSIKLSPEKNYRYATVIKLSDFSNGFTPTRIKLRNALEIEVTEFPRLVILEKQPKGIL